MDFFAGDARDVTARLAYELWEQRGRPFGSPEMDWFAAERVLASSRRDPLYGIALEPYEGPYRFTSQ